MAFDLKNITAKKEKPKKAARPVAGKKAFKATRGRRFVLFLGDEGAVLIYMKGNEVLSRQFVPDASQQSLNELRTTIMRDPKASIKLVVDTMDQSYVQQSLPPVTKLSVGRLIERRLSREFPDLPIKGALILGRDKGGRRDWNFLMVAVDQTPQLSVWLEFLGDIPNRFIGIFLVATEAEELIGGVEKSLGLTKEETSSQWKFFVSHNKVSGFRQVVMHNGRTVFTRLAQPIGDSNPEVIAGNIEQEVLSTIEYMKRLSYNPQTGLDLYILASSGIKQSIDSHKFETSHFRVFTPHELAELLGISGATQPTDQFGDVILAASIGCIRSHVLPLQFPALKIIDTWYKASLGLRALSIALALGMVGYSAFKGYEIWDQLVQIEDLEQKQRNKQRDLNDLKAEIERSNIDVEGASDIIDMYSWLLRERLSPIPFFQQLVPALETPVDISQVDWAVQEEEGGKKKAGGNRSSPPLTEKTLIHAIAASFVMEFPPRVNDQKSYEKATAEILDIYAKLYPEYEVSFSQLKTFEQSRTLDLSINAQADDANKDNALMGATLAIKGKYSMEAPADKGKSEKKE